jgi:hypothetical protein
LGGLAACTKYELMAKEIDWNFYSDSDGRGLTSKVWTYVDMNPNSKGEFATGVLRFKAHYGKPVLMHICNRLNWRMPPATIRLKLFKIVAVVIRNTRRIRYC